MIKYLIHHKENKGIVYLNKYNEKTKQYEILYTFENAFVDNIIIDRKLAYAIVERRTENMFFMIEKEKAYLLLDNTETLTEEKNLTIRQRD